MALQLGLAWLLSGTDSLILLSDGIYDGSSCSRDSVVYTNINNVKHYNIKPNLEQKVKMCQIGHVNHLNMYSILPAGGCTSEGETKDCVMSQLITLSVNRDVISFA